MQRAGNKKLLARFSVEILFLVKGKPFPHPTTHAPMCTKLPFREINCNLFIFFAIYAIFYAQDSSTALKIRLEPSCTALLRK